VLSDAEGTVLEGDNTVEPTAFFIHSRVHEGAPHATCVLHTHMPYATALTLREDGRLRMCEQNALMFYGRISYDDEYAGLALDAAEGERLAVKLGNGSALFLACHGVVVTGPNIAEAFTDLYYLERAAQAQVLAETGGHRLRTIPEDIQRTAAQQHRREYPGLAERHFSALRRILDKEEPDYRS
jgi:ribulose-5-phosphate 4-epimerase/fuculose-1-phosphate aldolase